MPKKIWILMAIGGGTVLIIILLLWLLSFLFSSEAPESELEAPESMTEEQMKEMTQIFVATSQNFQKDHGYALEEIHTITLPCNACWDISYRYRHPYPTGNLAQEVSIAVKNGRIDFIRGWDSNIVTIPKNEMFHFNAPVNIFLNGANGIPPGADIPLVKNRVESFLLSSEDFIRNNAAYPEFVAIQVLSCESCFRLQYQYFLLSPIGVIVEQKRVNVFVQDWKIQGIGEVV